MGSMRLNQREEDMMEMLWEQGQPMTSAEMKITLEKQGWNKSTLFNTIQSLLDRGYIRISGLERNHTQYARQFEAAVSKEEYMARLLTEKGITSSELANIALAMTGGEKGKKRSRKENDALIADLEQIISRLRETGD